jgi:putative PIN family toxin of toxin-antitoxin system
LRIVLDTNVVVSALLWGGPPYRPIKAAVDGALTLFTSPALLAELRGVLAREPLISRLERQCSSVEEAISLYAGLAARVSPEAVPRVIPADPDDDHVIAAAMAAKADLVISGDRHLLNLASYHGIRIVTPADALSIIPS